MSARDGLTDEERKEMKQIVDRIAKDGDTIKEGETIPVVNRIIAVEAVTRQEWNETVNLIYKKTRLFQRAWPIFRDSVIVCFKSFLSKLAHEESKLTPENQVKHFGDCWDRWDKSSTRVASLLARVTDYASDFDIVQTMRDLWKTHMFSTECKQHLVKEACNIIDRYRCEEPADLDLVGKLVSSLRKMDVAKKPQVVLQPKQRVKMETEVLLAELQKDVLEHTRMYYTEKNAVLRSMTPGEAVKYVKNVCDKERDVAIKYLAMSKIEELDSVLNDVLVIKNVDYFMQGFKDIVLASNTELGNAIMVLLGRVGLIDTIVTDYGNIIVEDVRHAFQEKVTEAATPAGFAEVIGSKYKFFDTYTKTAFPENVMFADSCNKALIEAMNDNAVVNQSKVAKELTEISKHTAAAKLIAAYVNGFMSLKRQGKEELKEKETMAIALYEFLKDKGSFQVQYRSNLARRLLHDETVSVEDENVLLDMLKKTSSGNVDEFVRANGMINDMIKRVDFNNRFFKSSGLDQRKSEIKFDPLLCSVSWPLNSSTNRLQLLKPMDDFARNFREFYMKNNPKQDLFLLHQYGRGEIGFITSSADFVLAGSEYQLVLLPLITSKGVTFLHLMNESLLNIDEVKYQLAFLIRNRLLLIKNEEGQCEADREKRESWLAGTVVRPNGAFRYKKKNIALTFSKADKEAGRSDDKTKSNVVSEEEAYQVMEDYVLRTMAVIVCVTKSRKKITNVELFAKIAEMLNRYFPLTKQIYKKAFERLVNDGILKRLSQTEVQYIG